MQNTVAVVTLLVALSKKRFYTHIKT